jgi:hypothetical protein
MAQGNIQIQRFTIDHQVTREYTRFNVHGTQLTVRLLPSFEEDDHNPMSQFLATVTEMFDYALRVCYDSDMVGITISNEDNVQDRGIGISFRRKNEITGDVIWSVFENVAQSNARFNVLYKIVMTVHPVKKPTSHGRFAAKVEH